MKILLVDDDVDVLEGMLDGIDFGAVGFEEVLTAVSAQQAKTHLGGSFVDVLVTDIEMPNENGLQLLEWALDASPDTVAVICTSFADFSYAKKAVSLHAFNYFLKPISYKALEDLLRNAAIEARSRAQDRLHAGDPLKMVRLEHEARENHWKEQLLRAATSGHIPDVPTEALQFLAYEPTDRLVLCLLQVHTHMREVTQLASPEWPERAAVYWEKDPDLRLDACVLLGEDACCHIFQYDILPDRTAFEARWRNVFALLRQRGPLIPRLYVAFDCSPQHVAPIYRQLARIARDDVVGDAVIRYMQDIRNNECPYLPPPLDAWEQWLATGRGSLVIQALDTYLVQLAGQGKLNRPILKAIATDVTQLVHSVLHQHGINAHFLADNPTLDPLQARSLRHLTHMSAYLSCLVETVDAPIQEKLQSRTEVDRIRAHILTHLEDPLSRASLAKEFLMNPDYLARIFREKFGISLGHFIQQSRIREAQRLLHQSVGTINEIAQKVGFDNFSYFSQLFRKATGLTPNEYRKAPPKSMTPPGQTL